jgi:hypothetical protein
LKTDLDELIKLDNNRLIEIVKNYRQFGYSDEYKAIAISILKDRGIDEKQLKMSGNFYNNEYNLAEQHFLSFKKYSKIAFIFYLCMIGVNVIISQIEITENSTSLIFIIGQLLLIIIFYISLGKSYIDASKYSRVLDNPPVINGLIYLFFSGLLYIFAYFYFKKVMKEEMKSIQ